jgi:hypothetical protein
VSLAQQADLAEGRWKRAKLLTGCQHGWVWCEAEDGGDFSRCLYCGKPKPPPLGALWWKSKD